MDPRATLAAGPARTVEDRAARLGLGCAAAAAALLAALTARAHLHAGAPAPVDVAATAWVSDLVAGLTGAAGLDRREALLALSALGSSALLQPMLLALAVLARRRGATWRAALAPAALLAGAQLARVLVVAGIPGSRPGSGEGPAFTSGHGLTAALGWGLVALACRRVLGPRHPLALTAAVAALLAPLAVAAARIALGTHWATDAVAGVVAGQVVFAVSLLAAPVARALAAPGRLARWRDGRAPWVVAGLAAAVSVVPLVLTPDPQRLKDLLVYHGAGAVAAQGGDVYGFETVLGMAFTYPPYAALLAMPIGLLPLVVVQVGWTVATLLALVPLARVALRPVVAAVGLPLTLAALLLTTPVRNHLRFGQVGVFLVVLVAVDVLHRRSGLGLGAAIALKLTPAVLLPWLLVSGQRGLLGRAVLWGGGLSLLASLLLLPSALDWGTRAVWDDSRFGANDLPGNQSVRGMLLRSGLAPHAAELLWLALAALLVAVATFHGRRLHRAGNPLAALGVLTALSVAVSPISWTHHLVWLALPVAALAAAGRWRLVAAWTALLSVGLPALATRAGAVGAEPGWVWSLLVDAQGLTAVAAVLLLPHLVGAGDAESRPATGCSRTGGRYRT